MLMTSKYSTAYHLHLIVCHFRQISIYNLAAVTTTCVSISLKATLFSIHSLYSLSLKADLYESLMTLWMGPHSTEFTKSLIGDSIRQPTFFRRTYERYYKSISTPLWLYQACLCWLMLAISSKVALPLRIPFSAVDKKLRGTFFCFLAASTKGRIC